MRNNKYWVFLSIFILIPLVFLPAQNTEEGVRFGNSHLNSGQLIIQGHLEIRDSEEFFRYLHQGHINLTTWTLSIGSTRMFNRKEQDIIQVQRRSWYDPFLQVYVLSDTRSPEDYLFTHDFEDFWNLWTVFSLDPILLPKIALSSPATRIILEARIEPYQLNPSLWILRPFLGSRVKVHRTSVPLAELES